MCLEYLKIFAHKNITAETLCTFNNVIDSFMQEHEPFLIRHFPLHVCLLSNKSKAISREFKYLQCEQSVASIDLQQRGRKTSSINSLFHYRGMTGGETREN